VSHNLVSSETVLRPKKTLSIEHTIKHSTTGRQSDDDNNNNNDDDDDDNNNNNKIIGFRVRRKMLRSSEVPLQAGLPYPTGYSLVLHPQTRHARIVHMETQPVSHLFCVLILPCLSVCSPRTYSKPYHHAHPRATQTKKPSCMCHKK